jgi:hypothetical protein
MHNAAADMVFTCASASDTACDMTGTSRDIVPVYSTDYWICKLESSGNILWDKTYGGDNFDDYTQISGFTGRTAHFGSIEQPCRI